MTDRDKEMMANRIAVRVSHAAKRRLAAARTIVNWKLSEWCRAVKQDSSAGRIDHGVSTPVTMRIENTMFTVGRYYGGMEYNKMHYTYFEPEVDGHEPNDDGSPYVAWLMVRDDFVERIIKEMMNIGTLTHTLQNVGRGGRKGR